MNATTAPVLPDLTYRCQGTVEAPRWAGIRPYLWSLALDCRVSYRTLDEQVGWLRHRLLYEIRGPRSAVDAFRARLHAALTAWNHS